jgi:hypothetical protein
MDTPEPIAKQIATRLGNSQLHDTGGRVFRLELRDLREVRPRAGWFQFSLALRDSDGQASRTPIMAGIVSGGGRGVMPWFEGRVYPTVEFAQGEQLDARKAGLEAELIQLLGGLVPAGGHLMLEYESPGQGDTHRELLLRVPPAATPLGALMFRAGFRGHFKDWYISEGGHEGPRKLQANKSPNPKAASEALHSNLEELRRFVKRPLPENSEDAVLVARAQQRARELLKEFGEHSRPNPRRTPSRKRR